MKFLLLFILLFSSSLTSASQIIGTITKIRGEVSILELGNRNAKRAELGQNLFKEASILTSEKSFVQIRLLDRTQINLGPSSKIVLDQTGLEKVGVIGLLKGILRTEVVKENGSKDKLYIKTTNAALGVRGTDFQTTFNPDNKITNLITFSGKVAMVKTQKDNLSESLNSKEAVFVESGKFAAISTNLSKATEPVKISPVQYTGLKLNPELNEEAKVSSENFQAELQNTIKVYAEITKKEEGVAAREYDVNNQIFRPTAGGVIDLATGIYVQPTISKENFNKDLNIYELSSEKGAVTEAGAYIPPKGVVLDANKGFIPDPLSEKTVALSDLKKLNNDISGQIAKPRAKPLKEELKGQAEDAYEKYFIKE